MEQTAPTLSNLHGWIEMSDKVNMEIFYWFCIGLMTFILAGFLLYEVGASRVKNVQMITIKSILAFAFVIPTFFFFGWWIYLSMYSGYLPDFVAGLSALPWSLSMGPNLADNVTGILWGTFVLFAAVTVAIFSAAVIERIRMGSFILLAILLGSGLWILGAAWSWHPNGEFVQKWGFHDFGMAGPIHMIAGFFTLGVLINLGARNGRFGAEGQINSIAGKSVSMQLAGLMLVIIGFLGFLGACLVYMPGDQWTSIFGNQTTLSAITFNTFMSLAGGIIGSYLVTNQPLPTMSGALAGIVAASPGMDLYYPPLAFLVGVVAGVIAPLVGKFLTRFFKIDDPVNAVGVHGFSGMVGIIALGIFSGYPNVLFSAPSVSFIGQLKGVAVMVVMGLASGFTASFVLSKLGVLRVPPKAEIYISSEVESHKI